MLKSVIFLVNIQSPMSSLFISPTDNKLSPNIHKTNYMIFKNRHSYLTYPDLNYLFIEGIKLSKVSHTKFLGIIINESLTWSNHTTHVANIVSKYSGIMFCLKQIFPCETLFS